MSEKLVLFLCGSLPVLMAAPCRAFNPDDWFREVVPSGLEVFRHVSGDVEKDHILDATSGGVCVLDFDNDGWMDLYLVNGAHRDILAQKRARVPSRLFRNTEGRGFADVSARAGASNAGAWGQGCAAADYNLDGWVDLLVTSYGPNRLYENNGDGTFTDVASRAGLDDPRWSTGAAWADFDRDGDLDLFVTNYVELSEAHMPISLRADGEVDARFCQYRGKPVFCGPRGLRGTPNVLYRNEANGTFTDVTSAAGVEESVPSYSFTAVWSDFDRDGRADLFVANDSTPNYLYHNNGDGTFEEIGYLSGTALGEGGTEQASMGVAVGDYDGDGFADLFLSHFSNDSNTLYRNLGDNFFLDATFASGVGETSIPYLGWGTFFFDYDNDGDSDLFVANGHVYPQVDTWSAGTTYLQGKQLFENRDGRFHDVTGEAGGALTARHSSRGAARLDYDNDGRLDIVINNLDGQPVLLRNELRTTNHFLLVHLENRNGHAIGAHVALRTGDRWQHAEVRAGSSYLSQNDPRLHFGLGGHDRVDELRIRWPSGELTVERAVKADQALAVVVER